MKVILYGATGMVGQGALRECLLDPDVSEVLAIGRSGTGREDAKLREIVQRDLTDLSSIEDQLAGFDACFFCLGVSAQGMSEPDYRRITYDLTLAVGQTLARLNPAMTFIYVSGEGTDSTGQGRSMWGRVKGETENALLALPFQGYMFRPGYIQPMHGVVSRNRLYRVVYAVGTPLFPVLNRLFPRWVTTNERIGRAMIRVAASGSPSRVLRNPDINALAV